MTTYKCPICEGHGFVPSSFYERAGETVSFGDYTRMQYRYTLCRHCSGKGVIQDAPTAAKQTPKTNGDRIRAMNDADLAAYIMAVNEGRGPEFCTNKPECEATFDSDKFISGEMCMECMVAWLRQPAEGGPHA